VFAVADGPSSRSRTASPTRPRQGDNPKTLSDFGGNEVMLEIAPKVYAVYGHLQPGSLR